MLDIAPLKEESFLYLSFLDMHVCVHVWTGTDGDQVHGREWCEEVKSDRCVHFFLFIPCF